MDQGGSIYSVEISKCQVPHSRDFFVVVKEMVYQHITFCQGEPL